MSRTPRTESVTTACRDCGTVFVTDGGELEWLTARGLRPYSRCPACRRARREAKARGQQP